MSVNSPCACLVVPVSIRPYAETEEFACVGVLLHAPAENRFSYRLAKASGRAFHRASAFFREIDAAILKTALKCAKLDIDHMIARATEELDPRLRENAFCNLIRPRENVIRYGRPRAVMTDDLEKEVERQYERIVQRAFIDREGYYEQKMRMRVMGYLQERKIEFERQKRYVFENGCYTFTMPVVIGRGAESKLIKPLNFVMKSGTDTMEHWFKWQRRFDYLRGEGLDKGRILAPVRLPSAEKPDVHHAAMIVLEHLREYTQTVDEACEEEERAAVIAFAS